MSQFFLSPGTARTKFIHLSLNRSSLAGIAIGRQAALQIKKTLILSLLNYILEHLETIKDS